MNSDCGVYMLSSPTGKSYISSSIVMTKRLRDHIGYLRKGTHPNKHMQSAWYAHGDDWTVTVLERGVSRELVRDRERYWMGVVRPSYNKTTNTSCPFDCDEVRAKHFGISAQDVGRVVNHGRTLRKAPYQFAAMEASNV